MQQKKQSQKLLLNKCGAGADCFFTTGVGLCYETSGAALLISSATCDGSKLREARLMLMCHHRGLVKTWFSRLSACKEHSGWLSGHRWLPPWGCWFQTSLELRIKTKQNKKKAAVVWTKLLWDWINTGFLLSGTVRSDESEDLTDTLSTSMYSL